MKGAAGHDLPFDQLVFAKELNLTSDYFFASHEAFLDQYKAALSQHDNAIPILSEERLVAALRAITHDLLRYAIYHRVGFDKRKKAYAICSSVRAAVFTKWILMLRPYSYDLLSTHGKIGGHGLRFCNEIAAVFCASHTLDLTTSKGDAMYFFEAMEEEELQTLLYHFRYRLKHQDTYSLMYRRIKETYAVV